MTHKARTQSRIGPVGRLLRTLVIALSCREPELPEARLADDATATGDSRPYCSAQENYADEPAHRYVCLYQGAGLSWREGDPTPSGPYSCRCDDELEDVLVSADCTDALARSCNVDPTNPAVPSCSGDSDNSYCLPVRGEPTAWMCICAPWEERRSVSADTCEEALFRQCGQCTSARGTCIQSQDDEREVEYLAEFDCTCDSASAQQDVGVEAATVHVGTEAWGDCPLAVALICGYPEAGERCDAFDNAGVASSCVADGEGNWTCDCPRFSECWTREHPTGSCDPNGIACVPPATATPGLDRPRVCAEALYKYCQCPG